MIDLARKYKIPAEIMVSASDGFLAVGEENADWAVVEFRMAAKGDQPQRKHNGP